MTPDQKQRFYAALSILKGIMVDAGQTEIQTLLDDLETGTVMSVKVSHPYLFEKKKQ